MTIYCIRYIPKDVLIKELWTYAVKSKFLHYCDINITLNNQKIQSDLYNMISNGDKLKFGIYHGKSLYVDVTSDTLDLKKYISYNGKTICKIITQLQIFQMKEAILRYYLFK